MHIKLDNNTKLEYYIYECFLKRILTHKYNSIPINLLILLVKNYSLSLANILKNGDKSCSNALIIICHSKQVLTKMKIALEINPTSGQKLQIDLFHLNYY